jgi:hypothetical protein
LPNVGKEQHSYLEHIVRNYDSLADRTIFLHGRAPSCGFFLRTGAVGGHLMANVSLADYLDSANSMDGVFMPITMRIDANLSRSSLRSSFADIHESGSTPENQSSIFLRRPPTFPAGDVGDHWLPWEANDFRSFIQQQAGRQDIMSLEDFWHAVFGKSPPPLIHFAQGAQFAASRAALRRVSQGTYEWIKVRFKGIKFYRQDE